MSANYEREFNSSNRPHVVMVTNHGVHEWSVNAGLPDTGGQNVYVNDLSGTLAGLGFRVTTFNRGGYPHPAHGTERTGAVYRNGSERIVYLTDSRDAFIRKEEMGPMIDTLAEDLAHKLAEGPPPVLVVSHYWDGAAVADRALSRLDLTCPHVWVPHSLGALKKEGTDPAQWAELHIDERIDAEGEILKNVDLVAATSGAIQDTLKSRYHIEKVLFLPPCVDETRFDRERVRHDRRAASLLEAAAGLPEGAAARRRIITEVSRTDRTKRKNILIEAFARVNAVFPDTFLALTIDPAAGELYEELTALIRKHGITKSVAVLGSIPEYIPSLYGMSTVYCTPSAMEGFGMSIQEAAACGVPAVASRRVPFAMEYLRGERPERRAVSEAGGESIDVGEGAVIVPPDSVAGTAEGLRLLLSDSDLRHRMGERAYRITIPRFTWKRVTVEFLRAVGVPLPAATGDGGNGGGDSGGDRDDSGGNTYGGNADKGEPHNG